MINSGLPFNVPLAVPIPAIVQSAINFRLDQVTRLLFQTLPQATPYFTSAADLQSKSVWDAGMAASDATRLIISPRFAMPKITPSKRLEIAGDSNATVDGMRMTFSKGIASFSGEFLCKDAASMASLDALFPYSQQNTLGGTNLGVMMINGAKPNGMVFSPDDFTFIPIFNFMTNSRESEGFAAPDKVHFEFDMLYNWADTLVCTIPTFDPNSVYGS